MELLRVGLVFLLLLVLIMRKVDLGASLIAGAFFLGLLYHRPLKAMGGDFLLASIDPETVRLIVVLFLVILLCSILSETGKLRQMVDQIQGLFRDVRITLALLPALIGLLPLIGGAIVSAPMVSAASGSLPISSERKTFLNFWFRHIWENSLPIYPGVILGASIIGLSIPQVCFINLPLTLSAIFAGILFGLRKVPGNLKATHTLDTQSIAPSLKKLCEALFPLFFLLFLALVWQIDLVYALLVTVSAVILLYRIPPKHMLRLIQRSLPLDIVTLVLGVMVFKKVMMSAGVVPLLFSNLVSMGIPPLLVLVLVPFSIGLMTGVTAAYVGISFPIFLPLFHADGVSYSTILLAYAGGYCGILLSPLHFCLALTRQYFGSEWGKVYRIMGGPVALVFATTLVVVALAAAF